MANDTEAQWNAKNVELMEKCFEGFAEMGLHGTGDGMFSPDATCTRAQIVTFLYRCLGDK